MCWDLSTSYRGIKTLPTAVSTSDGGQPRQREVCLCGGPTSPREDFRTGGSSGGEQYEGRDPYIVADCHSDREFVSYIVRGSAKAFRVGVHYHRPFAESRFKSDVLNIKYSRPLSTPKLLTTICTESAQSSMWWAQLRHPFMLAGSG